MTNAAQWVELKKALDPQRPASAEQYLTPPRSVAADIAEDIAISPELSPKYLLLGPTGGGKSSELRAIAREMGDQRIRVEIDLDASGLNATTLTAADLAYIAGIGMLRLVSPSSQTALFKELRAAYAGDASPEDLGEVKNAVAALAGFLDTAAGVITVAEVASGSPPVAGHSLRAGAGVLRLMTQRQVVVSESSPLGGSIQKAVYAIHEAAVNNQNHKSLCLIVDGLEKMNGQAAERFRQVFESTRLLVDLPCAAVFAAPACTLSETNSANALGWETRVVWAFADHPDQIAALLQKRIRMVDLDPDTCVVEGGLAELGKQSGGMPRYALRMAQRAVDFARREGSPKITQSQIKRAVDEEGEAMARGLREEDIDILGRVSRSHRLPGDTRAGRLFADGRILALPPGPGERLTRYVVHPLLAQEVRDPEEPA